MYAEFNSYYQDQRYRFVITEALQESCPKWDPSVEPNPPYSAAKVLEQAKQFISGITPLPDTFWRFEDLALVEVGGWVWRARYRLTRHGPSSGAWPSMDCWVLMDGTLIKPVISAHTPLR